MDLKQLGFIRGAALTALEAWMRGVDLSSAVKSTYAPGRLERWYRYGSNLQNVNSGGKLFKVEESPERVAALGDRLIPAWHSILLCGGDTTIGWHRDHGHFAARAVMINIGEATYWEQERTGETREYDLKHGQAVQIDTKLLHKATPLTAGRMNLTYREIKPAYLAEIGIHSPDSLWGALSAVVDEIMPSRTVVVNKRAESYDVDIGRGTSWGNPWTHLPLAKTKARFQAGSRYDSIKCFGDWLAGRRFTDVLQAERAWILDNLHRLKGKRLGCYCSPNDCHGDVYVEMIENGS